MRKLATAILAVAALTASACGADAGGDATATPAPTVTVTVTPTPMGSESADPVAAEGDDELAGLCNRYMAFVFDPTQETAQVFLDADQESFPTGVWGTVSEIAEGGTADIEKVVGYFGGICAPYGEFEGTTDTNEDRAAAGMAPVSWDAVCLELHDTWSDGDRAAADRFGDAQALDDLFSIEFQPPANSAIAMGNGDCFYSIPDWVAEIVIADSDVEAFIVQTNWYTSDDFFADEELAARFEAAR